MRRPASYRLALLTLLVVALARCGGTTTSPDAGGVTDTGVPRLDAPVERPDAGPLPACGSTTPLALGQCVETSRWSADLTTIAMPREPESTHWMEVQDLVATRLESLGFTVERVDYGTGVNVIGTRAGTSDATHDVVLGAHYDHIPDCAGADDNASGVAGALEAARVLSMASYPRTLVVVFWDEEERGLIGSEAHAAAAMTAGDTIDAVFDFEMIGYTDDTPGSQTIPTGFDILFADASAEVAANEYRGDFIAAVGNEIVGSQADVIEHYADAIGLPFVQLIVADSVMALVGDLRRSDHASYWDTGVPAMMLTDTSNFRYENYHCFTGEDVVANLDPEFATLVVRATVGAVAESLGMPR